MKKMYLWLRDSRNNLIAKVHITNNRFFPLNLQTIDAKCLKANVQDDSWCRHMRFEHLNFEVLKSMGDKNMVDGKSSANNPNQSCEACLLRNMQGDVFQRRLYQKQVSHFNLYILMCVVQSIHHSFGIKNTSCSLLKISVERLEYTSWSNNLKFLFPLKISKHLEKKKVAMK